MPTAFSPQRRRFLGQASLGAGLLALPRPGTMPGPLSIAEVADLAQKTPRAELVPLAARWLRDGTSWRTVLGGAFLAGVRDIRPRPVGFRLHAVMMSASAYQLAESAPAAERAWPVFFNLADFKLSQAADARAGDWTLGEPPAVEEGDAAARFRAAMDAWDDAAGDAAAVALHATAGLDAAFEEVWPYAARDFANIGHKMIFAAQAYRTLQQIGWVHGQPVLRQLVHGLLLQGDAADRAPFAANRERVVGLRVDFVHGAVDPARSVALARALRECDAAQAAAAVVEASSKGLGLPAILDGLRLRAAELLARAPNILSVHPLTTTNAFAFALRTTQREATRRVLLLQAASWLALFGAELGRRYQGEMHLDELAAAPGATSAAEVLEIAGDDRDAAMRQALRLAQEGKSAELVAEARALLFRKAKEHHDHKLAAAAFEEASLAHPELAPRILAASFSYLRHAREEDGESYAEAVEAVRRAR